MGDEPKPEFDLTEAISRLEARINAFQAEVYTPRHDFLGALGAIKPNDLSPILDSYEAFGRLNRVVSDIYNISNTLRDELSEDTSIEEVIKASWMEMPLLFLKISNAIKNCEIRITPEDLKEGVYSAEELKESYLIANALDIQYIQVDFELEPEAFLEQYVANATGIIMQHTAEVEGIIYSLWHIIMQELAKSKDADFELMLLASKVRHDIAHAAVGEDRQTFDAFILRMHEAAKASDIIDSALMETIYTPNTQLG